MTRKLLLSISAGQVTAARWSGGRLAATEVFTNDEAGLAAFRQYLGTAGGTPVHVLVDAVEEDYRYETLPPAYGRDRREMLDRKLRQLYRNTPYASAVQQGRETGRRRDGRFLFMALTNPDLVAPWVEAIAGAQVPVAGVFPMPMVVAALIARLRLREPNLLVVSLHSAGVRIAYFREQRLRISRLARLDVDNVEALASLAEEITNTRLYLHSLRAMTLDEPATLLVLDRRDELAEVTAAIARANPTVECRRLSRAEIMSGVQISAPALDSSGDALYLHLLGLGTPAGNLAPPDVTAGFSLHRARNAIYALAGACAAAALAWSASNVLRTFDVRDEIARAEGETRRLQAEYQEVARQFPSAPTNADNLRHAVALADMLARTERTPESFMVVVSRALEKHPSVALRSLAWRHGRSEIEADPAKTVRAAAEPSPPPGPGARRRESGMIEGEIRPFRGDYRAAIEEINAFARALAADPAVADVRVAELPLNIASGLSLSGNTLEAHESGPGSARFRLVVILRQAA